MNRIAPTQRLERWAWPVNLLPSALLEPQRPLRAILIGWLTALLPSLLLGAAVTELLPNAGQPNLPVANWVGVFLMVIFAPLVETLIMAGVLALLLRLVPATIAVVLSAVGWGVAHSMAAPAWGLVVWWPFVVFSTLYVTWRHRSFAAAILIPAAAHALQNLLPSLVLLAGLG